MQQPLAARLLRLLDGPCRNWTMEELKTDLHASRSAIWQALDALAEDGYITIEGEEEEN